MRSSSKTPLPTQLEFDFCPPSQPSAKPEPLLTIGEACVLYNVRPHHLRRAIRAGTIPRYQIGTSRIRVRATDIERAIEASRAGGPI
jgi:excisionase family DNA binding protein